MTEFAIVATTNQRVGAVPRRAWVLCRHNEMEKLLISSVPEHTGGNRTCAAEILGISREGLRTKLQRLHIPADQDPVL
jgi:DNA-binding NtrC family response regulator